MTWEGKNILSINCLLMMTAENLQEKIEYELHISKAIS